MRPSTIGSINLLPENEKHSIYARYIPSELLAHFGLPAADSGKLQELLKFNCPPGSSSMEMSLYHELGFEDPVLYAHIADTINGQLHVLLYVLNDPDSSRYDVDRMPDGTPTKFGTLSRNKEAEKSALEAGLAPGQVRRGLRLLGAAITKFEEFVRSLGQELYFVEPLYYHNAVLFERYGFSYQVGRRLMDEIHAGFKPDGRLTRELSRDDPFRRPGASESIRLRSWAIHDGILGKPFTDVTMYKTVGQAAAVDSTSGLRW